MSNKKPTLSSTRQAFGDTLNLMASKNKNIFVVSVDLKSSLKLSKFAKKYPNRFIECGVAEQNATAIAAGLAKSGKTVFLCSYSSFSPAINWAVIKQSICYNNCNVKIISAHSGLLTSAYGATHQMLEDIALVRVLPNMEVFSPCDAIETKKIISVVANSKTPAYVRLVRPDTPLFFDKKLSFTIGKSHVLKKGKDITILGHGPILHSAFQIHNQSLAKLSLEIINCSSIKPLDSKTILKSVKKTGRLIVIEDHQKIGGLGEAIAHLLLENNLSPKFIHLAVDNQFGQSARHCQELYDYYNIGIKALTSAIKKIIS
ncbi:transketolase family protein [Patescibacteria group bacterium]|nr:transketolase family protein [Patescibacteria group bacterium]MCG2702751.1 transketolase family protein [Candidatus Parcubacteria bacterium]MBU4265452.1 transketolase family protein [Patescibacteria group bacterium]MBU4390502.1 transketolase family protein [Patescibacteria group bacterium]MBU4430560.1 transketolase family protein [Patescibacteria group bacterium]